MVDSDGAPKCGTKQPSECEELTTIFAGCGLSCTAPAITFALEFLIPGQDCTPTTATPTTGKPPLEKSAAGDSVTGKSLSTASKLFATLASSLLACVCIVSLAHALLH